MQKIIVTYLTFIILFQGISVNSDILYQLNEMIEDYQIHKVKYDDNLTTFIAKHFGDLKESHKKEHQEEHKQRKHPVNELNNDIQVDFALNFYCLNTSNYIESSEKSSNFSYSNLFSTYEKSSVFQPPKFLSI